MEFLAGEAKVLLTAARDGELEQLKRSAAALDHVIGAGLPAILENTKDDDGRSAIHCASFGGRVNVLKYLIEDIKFDVDVKTNSGKTPLSFASMEGHLAAVEYLLEMGANPEIPDDRKSCPLHHAAVRGHKEVIHLLLSKGINVDFLSANGSPLQYAAIAGKHDTVNILLDHGANPNLIFFDTFPPLLTSIHAESWPCTEALLKAGADPNGGPDGMKPLSVAAEMGLAQILKPLVEAGADPNVTNILGLKPIEITAFYGHRRCVEILFPLTSPIPSYVDWSINGIMKHVNSDEFCNKRASKAKENFLEAKSRGTSAFERKEYWLATHWYTRALDIKPFDVAVLSNRSLCFVHLDKGAQALKDASQCVLRRPNWPKAFYRAGVALKLLNRFDDAADAFLDGLKLDPKNKELEAAFREVSLAKLKAMNVPL